MAPLSEAIRTELAFVRHDETHVYRGRIDPEWTITVPHGGYVLCTVLDALLQHQASTAHVDPAHLAAQFLTASTTEPAEFQIHLKTYSSSKRWTRIDITFLQVVAGKDAIRIRGHAIFTTLPDLGAETPAPSSPTRVTIMPSTPIPYARLCPLPTRPSQSSVTPMYQAFNFRDRVKWAELDLEDSKAEKKMDWGSWYELVDRGEDVRSSARFIPFFADMFVNGPETLPTALSPGPSWFPTMTLALDFKSKFPITETPVLAEGLSNKGRTLRLPNASNAVGLYSYSKFVHEGRHDQVVEVWSAPENLTPALRDGPGADDGEWRKGCRILAVSTQMALVLPDPGRVLNLNKSKL